MRTFHAASTMPTVGRNRDGGFRACATGNRRNAGCPSTATDPQRPPGRAVRYPSQQTSGSSISEDVMNTEAMLSDLQNRARKVFGGRQLLERLSDSCRGIEGSTMLAAQTAGNSICLTHRLQCERSASQLSSFSEALPT
jgi:hypothetical protein